MNRILCIAILVILAGAARGQSMWSTTQVWNSGPSDQRIDLVILGDGYQANEIPLFHTHVANFMNFWFSREPFTKYKNLLNVWRVDVESNDSGSDHPNPCWTTASLKDTELDTSYCIGGTKRCVQPTGSMAQLTTLMNVPVYDEILVFVNDPEYGGCAGSIACSTAVHSAAWDVAVHELGHSIFGLADEYGGNATYTGPQFSQVNASNIDAAAIAAGTSKWHLWIGSEGISGFESCRYHDFGAWRPRSSCMMRSLGQTFCAVCREETVDVSWSAVNDADLSTPPHGPALLPVSPITVEVPVPDGALLSPEWYVDGVLIGAGTQNQSGTTTALFFDPGPTIGASTATHVVELQVYDLSPWRRKLVNVPVMPAISWTMSSVITDYEMQAFTALSTPGLRGEYFRVETTVTNNGPSTAPPTKVGISVLTTNGVVPPLEAGSYTTPSLAPGATDTRIIECRLPANAAVQVAGISLEAKIDDDDVTVEPDETNNVLALAVPPIDPTATLSTSHLLASWSVADTISVLIDAGPNHAGEAYAVIPSLTDPAQGVDLGPFVGNLFIEPDGFSDSVLGGQLFPFFVGWAGHLDSNGQAAADFIKPSIMGMPTITMYFNYLTVGTEPTSGSTIIPMVGNLTALVFLP